MSEWISVKDRLPEPFEIVWIYWRDQKVVLGFRTYTGKEHLECPPDEGWYSYEYEKARWTKWWMPHEDHPLFIPPPPKQSVAPGKPIPPAKRLKVNRIQCLKCYGIIESKHGHDFKYCKCGACFIDGGLSYQRIGGDPAFIKDLSEWEPMD